MRLIPYTLLSIAISLLSNTQRAESSSTRRNPIGAITTLQNATLHTHGHKITALSEFELSFSLEDEINVKFQLEPNHDILPADAIISYLSPDGTISRREGVDRLAHKIFKGDTWIQRRDDWNDGWRKVGWARVSILQDGEDLIFEGGFSVDHDAHHVQTVASYRKTRHENDPEIADVEDNDTMILWRDSDVLPDMPYEQRIDLRSVEADSVCAADTLSFNMQPDHPVFAGMRKRSGLSKMDFSHLWRRQTDTTTGGNGAGVNLVSTIGNTAGCPSTRKVALVGVATDCTYTADFNSTQSARDNVINQLNLASAVWEDAFNISLGLQNLTISDATCPGSPPSTAQWNQQCSSGVNIGARLNLFSAWRGNQVDTNSHWTLLSKCNTGSAVGLAWLGQACVQTAYSNNGSSSDGGDTVSGANVVIRTSGAAEWQILAHETGHTFGAVHDCDSSACQDANFVSSQQCCQLSSSQCDAGGRYIMNPSTGDGINRFSPCSIGNICSAIGRNSVKTSCLSNNRQVTTITGQQCGNGIVETGEDCDCGGPAGCGNNKCCNPTTCKFQNNAVCDDSNEDCCNNCQFASNGTVCRASTGVCDPQEVCTGSSPLCPSDQTSPDGQSCGNSLQCASGHCTSRDQQCQSVMGNYARGNDTYACDSSSCVITCASPQFGADVCYSVQQNFLDGTTCAGGGTCQNGICQGTSTAGQISSWINDHKAIVIGVSVAVGVLLLIAIIGCVSRCCCRPRRVKAVAVPAPVPTAGGWQGWNNRPQPPMYQSPQHPSQGWFNSAPPNGPPPPPPIYGNGNGRSVRYA